MQWTGKAGFADRLPINVLQPSRGDPLDFLHASGLDPKRLANAAASCDNPHDIFEALHRFGDLDAGRARRLRAVYFGCAEIDPSVTPQDPSLAGALPGRLCAKRGVVPWMRCDGRLVLATARPELLAAADEKGLKGTDAPRYAAATEQDVTDAIMRTHGEVLAEKAVTSVLKHESSRALAESGGKLRQFTALVVLSIVLMGLVYPVMTFVALTLLAVAVLWASLGLKTLAFIAQHIHERRHGGLRAMARGRAVALPPPHRRPVVSLLVPLHKESQILPRLVARLSQIDWPKNRLDVKFVCEADDVETLSALDQIDVPPWIQIIRVPDGQPKTKPRAMNVALDFCRGEFVGIYDAEDRPEPDQVARMVATFDQHGPSVACVQGLLDYYNPHQNWLSRCFTIEYAAWFRIILPGIERLNLPVPLGGTTVFFRRSALEELGRWDAHNVTEDADLGIRIHRHGLRTAVLRSATYEEANCFGWAWVRQRSRWLKGYMLTWLVHMQTAKRLRRELGPRAHLGFQVLFVSTSLHFLLAPFLWSFWAAFAGWEHPVITLLGERVFFWVTVSFIFAEVMHLAVTGSAVAAKERRFLLKWLPTMHFYYVLGTVAAFKALLELITNPFFWDKTTHGHSLDLVKE